jgi:hypothetical protein
MVQIRKTDVAAEQQLINNFISSDVTNQIVLIIDVTEYVSEISLAFKLSKISSRSRSVKLSIKDRSERNFVGDFGLFGTTHPLLVD